MISFRGETKTLADWARSKGLAESTLRGRLKKGMGLEVALSLEPQSSNGTTKKAPLRVSPILKVVPLPVVPVKVVTTSKKKIKKPVKYRRELVWVERNFEVLCGNRKPRLITVLGWTHDIWGVRYHNDMFSLIHIPTGKRVSKADSTLSFDATKELAAVLTPYFPKGEPPKTTEKIQEVIDVVEEYYR
jgi:hypothetical protein